MGGTKEVKTPAGNIDLLTPTHIIEVKIAHNWKHGLGQLLAYSEYFPYYAKRLHLFSYQEISAEFLHLVIQSCERLSVEATTETVIE